MRELPNPFEQAAREIARDRILAERVTVLHPDMEPRERARHALRGISDAIATLEMVADELMLNAEQVQQLTEAETAIVRVRSRVKLRRRMLHLAGVFGRAP